MVVRSFSAHPGIYLCIMNTIIYISLSVLAVVLAVIVTTLISRNNALKMSMRMWKEQNEVVQQQFSALAGDVLEKKSEALERKSEAQQKENREKMDAMLTPLGDALRQMNEAVVKSREQNASDRATLAKAIEDVLTSSRTLGEEAGRLADALTNKSEVQGIWGEYILQEILESQGLEEHKHYDLQKTLRDGNGKIVLGDESQKKMRPDAILYYPDNKCVIVDSKVSLTAFLDYCNAETEEARAAARKAHLISVRSHVKELADKNYSAYVKEPYESLPYVLMFMPNESALQLALTDDTGLWREAFQRGVFITSENNLIAALRMIELAWTQSIRAANQQKIFDTAQMLLDRVSAFWQLMTDIGAQLDKAEDTWKRACDKLRDGRQSVVGAANKLVELGAKASPGKQLPENNPE